MATVINCRYATSLVLAGTITHNSNDVYDQIYNDFTKRFAGIEPFETDRKKYFTERLKLYRTFIRDKKVDS